jgi:Fungal N-terminal domain of STAND proteins
MSDPLSIIASVTGVVAFGFQVSVTVANFISDIKDAPSYVLSLKNEIDGLSSMLQRLEEKLRVDFNGTPPYPHEVAMDLKKVLSNLNNELERVDKYMKQLSIEGKHFRTWHSLVATLKRKYMEEDITTCQRKIEAYKGTLNGLVITTIRYI